MTTETERSPIGLLLDACDQLGMARDMLELLFAAGGGLHAAGESCGSGIVRGTLTAQAALEAAQALLHELQGAMTEAKA